MRLGLLGLFGQSGVVLAAGAHDALSAKLAEEAGFDAVWASGFGISAVRTSARNDGVLVWMTTWS